MHAKKREQFYPSNSLSLANMLLYLAGAVLEDFYCFWYAYGLELIVEK